MTHRLLFTALLATLLGGAAWAQTTPAPAMGAAPAATISPAKKELIAKVIALQQPGIEALARNLAQQPLARMLVPLNQALRANIPADKREAVAKDVDAEGRKFFDEVMPLLRSRATALAPDLIGPILEKDFNEEELRQLAAWLESPVSKKYAHASIEMQSALAQKVVADTRSVVEPKLKAFQERIAPMVGLKVTKPPAASAASGAGKSKP
ncbi:MAG: DUF2059 domain-containing protein [Betaproteobacteria bacterium]